MLKRNIFAFILLIVNFILVTILSINILKLNFIPEKYLILALSIYILLIILIILLLFTKKIFFRIILYFLLIVIITVSSIGIYYTSVTIKFFDKSFNNIKNTYKNTYYVISKEFSDIYDLIDKKIGYYDAIPNIDRAIEKLNSNIEFETESFDNIIKLFEASGIDAIIIEKTIYDGIIENMKNIDFSIYKTVTTLDIETDEEIVNEKLKDVINIYIGGVDFTETFNDFNMIVTINRKTKQVLLTSIPRDYYIYVPSLKTKDLLDYTLLWGVNTPIEALEELFNIDIDYYVQINTKSLVGIVDTLNGVDFCSDFAFTTTHAAILDSYDDSKGPRVRVQKGCKTYNGIEILTIARERLVYAGGDRQRQKNCQQILINIFNKLLTFNSINNYNEILDSLSDLYTTNIPQKYITSLMNDVISGNKYEILTQSADGKSGAGYVHVGTYYGPVMIPNNDSVLEVTNKLKEIQNIDLD